MTIEEKLKSLILTRYSSIRDFAINAEIPYTTIRSILERGVENASISNVIKICKALSISVDALANGEIENRFETSCKTDIDITDIVNEAKAKLSDVNHLTINGQKVDIEIIEPIVEALDIGYEMSKRKVTKTITKS